MIYRRCSCRDEHGKPYGNLPENPSEQQIARACPTLLADPKHGKWGYYLSRGFAFDPKTKKMRRLQTRVANFTSKRAAQSAYAKAKTGHDAGQFRETNRTQFAQWCDEWLSTSGLSAGLVAAYRRYFENDVAPSALGRMRLSDIRRADVQRFVDSMLAAGRGVPTVKKAHRGISSALTAAVRGDLIPATPANGVVFPKERRAKFEPWSPAQAGRFLDHAAQHRLGVVLEVAMFTGLRPAELAGLRWIDVDLASRTLTVRWTRTIVDGKVEEKEPKTEESQASIDLEDRAVGALVEQPRPDPRAARDPLDAPVVGQHRDDADLLTADLKHRGLLDLAGQPLDTAHVDIGREHREIDLCHETRFHTLVQCKTRTVISGYPP
ncbi:MAG TPA: hypothetical protein EYQ02_12960, partial [Microbacterium sp.]|nr:hypothetical protein [Microbacterium sp.]